MLFKKMRTTIDQYRTKAASLDPQASGLILGMLSSGSSTKNGRRVAHTDPQLAVALFLLELERDNGTTAEQFNEMVQEAREEARTQGIPEEELEAFLVFHFREQLAQQGVEL
jgi:hypothetical protein